MGEDDDGRVERRVGTPPALSVRILVPSGVAELAGPPDLRAAPLIVPVEEGVVDAAAATRRPPPGGEHPLMQPLAGVAERGFEAQAFDGAEAIERDGELLDVGA